jgi:hypothetical protein
MPATLEKQLEKAKKAVEVAKKNYKNAKPPRVNNPIFTDEASVDKWMKDNRNNKEKLLQPAFKALKALETAEAKLGRLETKIYNKKGGKTRRSKRGTKGTRRH